MAKLSVEKVKKAMDGSYGIQTVIAARCGVSRAAITQFFDKHPEFRKLQAQETEKILDVAEAKAMQRINDGSDRVITFILSTKGKARGYGEALELTNKEVNPEMEKIRNLLPKEKQELIDMAFKLLGL